MQLDFSSARVRRAPLRSVGAGALRFCVYWMPVWVPLVLLFQVSLRGLRPALREHDRLLREEQVVTERFLQSRADFLRMEAEAEAWRDPVYRERLRRLR